MNKVIDIRNPRKITKMFFPCPTIVEFKREDEDEVFVGIAYNKEIICLCCGGITPLDEATMVRYHPEVWKDVSVGVQAKLETAYKELGLL